LLHSVEAAVIVCEGPEILPEHLPASVRSAPPPAVAASHGRLPTLAEMEVEYIRSALEASHGHRGNAAKMLGISERNLYRKLKEYRLET
jgi:DNA-binding NtrC family response regulator